VPDRYGYPSWGHPVRVGEIAGGIIGINRLTATRIPPVIPWHPDATRREGT